MRNLLIMVGPSEQPHRLTPQSDTGPGHRGQRGIRRGHRSRRFRWAQPSHAMAIILRGLRATLLALAPAEIRGVARPRGEDMRVDGMRGVSSISPQLRLVGDCGGAREAGVMPAAAPPAIFHAAATPRHHVRSVETPREQRRRLRLC
ncbi:hypothetical protein HL667_16195 [Bradyrhizobium sp. 83012]|uniref:Uncharacterized protein n=1 Tax=Bradyrhizobium aeschynomenes TaxID=2734909 RepID=A0ABX2CE93_9BRAD|nr:hypothetical protein [Bradyrhizobium aeschynomenes]NPU66546.1 hypothetical protein [Bradyrhizobium aeschynomenes]